MRIAVSYDYGQVAPRFSAEQRFKVYDVCNNCVGHQSVVSTIGDNDTAARALSTLGVDTVICGSIRDNAKNALDNAGITDMPWFLLDSKGLEDMDGAIFQDRVKLIVRSVLDDNNDNNLWKGRGRYSAGFADWRFIAAGGMTGGSAL